MNTLTPRNLRHTTKLSALRELIRIGRGDDWSDDDVFAAIGDLMEQCHPHELDKYLVAGFNAINGDDLQPENSEGANGVECGSKVEWFLSGACQGIADSAYRHVARILGLNADGFAAIMNDNAYDDTLPQHQVSLDNLKQRCEDYWRDEPTLVSSATPPQPPAQSE